MKMLLLIGVCTVMTGCLTTTDDVERMSKEFHRQQEEQVRIIKLTKREMALQRVVNEYTLLDWELISLKDPKVNKVLEPRLQKIQELLSEDYKLDEVE